MKFVIALVAALLAVVAAAPADPPRDPRPTPAKGDFRSEFDHMMISTTTERFHQLEQFLLHLAEEVANLEKEHKPEEKERILREIATSQAFIHGANGFLERELKRTDLNVLEQFNFEIAQATGKILEKDLLELSKRVQAIKA